MSINVGQYVHVICEEYALLTDIANVEQVVKVDDQAKKTVRWAEKDVPFVDLTEILMGYEVSNNKHCIIMKSAEQGDKLLAVGVGKVANIESIKDDEFEELPNIDFPFNDYFDRAYFTKDDKRCVYRLKNLVDIIKTK